MNWALNKALIGEHLLQTVAHPGSTQRSQNLVLLEHATIISSMISKVKGHMRGRAGQTARHAGRTSDHDRSK